ncbi:MAG: HAD-IIB family hydrolase [Thermoplasmatota archaeon]
MRSLATSLGVADRVRFLGHVPERDLAVAYARARAIVLPSETEGFGLVVVEGWRASRAAIVSRGAGVHELVDDGVNGYTFAPGDADALAAHMRLLARDPEIARSLGAAGLKTAELCSVENAAGPIWRALAPQSAGRTAPRVLLTDLDRTLTRADLSPDPRIEARLAALEQAGIRVVVVTGRTLAEVRSMALAHVVSGVVAENGAVIHMRGDQTPRLHDASFRERARRALGKLDASFHWGDVVGSAPRSLEADVRAALERASLDAHLEFNADELMVLPARIDKASGALDALVSLGARPADAWAIGDGDNDASLFRLVGHSAAVANASPAARRAASETLVESHADGFLAFTARLLPVGPA